MSYEKGDLKIFIPCTEPWGEDCQHDEHPGKEKVAYLPHSCGIWEIGDIHAVSKLIADLEEATGDL